jgi:SNF2 family DNA or RNA helicase
MSELWRHQAEALSFVEHRWATGHRGALLAMHMGTGKSRVVVELAKRNQLSPALILCPLRVVDVWTEQFGRYGNDYEVLPLGDQAGTVAEKAGAANERIHWCAEHGRPLAIAINYESARLVPFNSWSLRRSWPLVIADESHRLKQPSGAISRYAGKLGLVAGRRIGLTGTPAPHSVLDLWAQFRFLDRTIYDPTFTSFRARYAVMAGYLNKEVKEWQNLDELREKFLQAAYQVGPEVLDLPEEQEQTLFCTLGGQAQRIYNEMERDLVSWIDAGYAVTAQNALVRLLRLAQITDGVVKDNDGMEHVIDTSKQTLLKDLLEDLAADEPVVIFARFRSDLEQIHAAAQELGRRSGELSGERDDLSAWKRGAALDPVILAVQIQAGGVGIDLTRARYAIYFSIGFNLADYLQSRARIYRAGQLRPVMFYHLMVGNTIDPIVMRALERRQDLVDATLKELPCQKMTTASR